MDVSERFLSNIQKFGKQIRLEITMDGIMKSNDGIISCSKSFNGEMFKTIMQYVEVKLVGLVDVGETISIRFGVLDEAMQEYDFLDWGQFIVDKDTIEKDIGTNSTSFTAYDYILKSCVEYKQIDIMYPITVKELLGTVCNRIGLTLCSESFANAEKEVNEDKFINGEYTYRDVLDHIAGAVGGAIITKGSNLYIKYPTQTSITLGLNNQKTMRLMEKWGPVNSLVLSLQPQEDNYFVRDEQSIIDNGLTEVKISNNELIYKERDLFAEEIFNKINGFSFYPFEVESFGYGCLEPYDLITIQNQDSENHSCLVLNDTVSITGGMNEQINTQMPEIAVTDYSKATSSSKMLYKTLLQVDKQNQKIEAIVETVDKTVKEVDLSKIHRSPVPPENPEESMLWVDISDNDNPILYVYLQIDTDEDDNPIYGWVQGNDHIELQNLKRSYQELTSDSWIVEVTQQVLQSDETKELVKQSEMTAQLQALKDQISMTLEEMSGYNLLLNSTGWNNTNFWALGTTGSVETISDNDVSDNTVSEHAFKLSNGMTLSQSVKVKQGNVYTISCAYKKYMTKAHVKVIQGDKVDYLLNVSSTDYTDEDWHEADLTFTAVSKEITVELYASAEYLMVSDLIVNDGGVKKLWTSHNDEIYTAGVKIDKTGISIDQSDTDTTTRIDSKEFAVIDKNSGEKVLRVNRDTTELSRLNCTDSAQIGKMLIVASEDGNRTDFVVLD